MPAAVSSASRLGELDALALDELAHPRADAIEHLGGQQLARRARPVGRVADGFEQLGHAHHAELVEVGREDRGEAQPLEQRHALVAGELEHARVPLEPRQLAVEEARLLSGLLRRGGRPSHSSGDQCERTGAQEPAQLAALAGDRIDRRGSRLGKRDVRARDVVDSADRSGSWPTSTRSSPWRSVRPARSSASTPSSAGSSASGAPSSSRDDLGRLACARVRARHDALRLDAATPRAHGPWSARRAALQPPASARDRACRARDPRPPHVGRG